MLLLPPAAPIFPAIPPAAPTFPASPPALVTYRASRWLQSASEAAPDNCANKLSGWGPDEHFHALLGPLGLAILVTR